MFEIQFSKEAQDDLDNILQYSIDTFGEIVALKYLQKLNSTFNNLMKYPEIGHLRNDLSPKYLSFKSGRHFIVYRIVKRSKKLLVVRLLHEKMDFRKNL